MPTHEKLTNWRGSSWDELVGIWRDLVGDPAGEDDDNHRAVFQGQALEPREAGYVFERWVVEAFRNSSIDDVDGPFDVPANPGLGNYIEHQIDGVIWIGWNAFLIESKFQRVDFGPVARLHLLAESRPVGTLALLFAARGFTTPAIDSAHVLRPIRVLLFNRADIEFAVERRDMRRALELKWRVAVKYSRPNFPISQSDQAEVQS